MENQKQRQEQGQKPPTTYAPERIHRIVDALQYDTAANGALVRQGHHLSRPTLAVVACYVLDLRPDPTVDRGQLAIMAACLGAYLTEHGVTLNGKLLGTRLSVSERQRRLERLVAVIRGG